MAFINKNFLILAFVALALAAHAVAACRGYYTADSGESLSALQAACLCQARSFHVQSDCEVAEMLGLCNDDYCMHSCSNKADLKFVIQQQQQQQQQQLHRLDTGFGIFAAAAAVPINCSWCHMLLYLYPKPRTEYCCCPICLPLPSLPPLPSLHCCCR
jgi:hypothetical protein